MRAAVLLLLATLLVAGCADSSDEQASIERAPGPPNGAPADEPLPPLAYESALPESVRAELNRSFKGDLDEMVQRRLVRIGVTFNRTHYFVDQGVQRGVAYEYGRLMEEELNRRRKTGNLKVSFWFVPLPRDQLLPALVDGKVDMVMAQLTVTPERQKLVDFTNPTREGVNEILVTGPGAPPIATVDDLSGQEVFVRRTSSYYQSLLALNQRLKAAGRPPVAMEEAPENLEDEDLLEMVNAGLVGMTVVDNYLADFWKQVLPDLTVHDGVAVRTGGRLAVAIRKNSPQLAAGLNGIIAEYGLGTAFGNMMEQRYLQGTKYVRNATSEAERAKFLALIGMFRRYSDQYGMDYLLMAAQGFQESGLDQSVKSQVGAIGVMQVMPTTGKELKVGDISKIEPNIHAGVKYIRWVVDTYYKDEPMDRLNKGLFAFASYNAGPGRIRQLRREAEKRGLDPNVWFGNVEQIASERIGRETVTYVSNIYKYYVAYRLVLEEKERREAAKKEIGAAGAKPAR
ncbi:MAG: lytic transglycosylase F [Chromatiales bacterium]|nr:lytic transglycosylase F [Chromatiales bacterium]